MSKYISKYISKYKYNLNKFLYLDKIDIDKMDIDFNIQLLFKNIYFKKQNNNPPIFLQIIGWTKNANNINVKRKYVYVRKIPLNIKNYLHNGGYFSINYNNVINCLNDLKIPIKKPFKNCLKAIIKDNGTKLMYNGQIIPLWNEYNNSNVNIQI